MAAYGITPVFDSIIKQNLLKKNIMSFYYSNTDHVDGQITLGFIDENKYTGPLRYYKVTDKFYWTIKLDDILLDRKSLNLCQYGGCNGIVDTGTSLITGPTQDLNVLLNAIPVEDDCRGYERAPVVTFVFNGDHYDMTKEDYILKDKTSDKKCRALMMPLDVPIPQ
jgi:hypothetical protein